MAYPDFLLDKRVVHRNIAKGLVDRKIFAKHLKALTDVESNAEACVLEVAPVAEPADPSVD